MHSLEETVHPNLVEIVRVEKFNRTFETYINWDHRKQLYAF